MSAIAKILISKGFSVSGSDHKPNQHTEILKTNGVQIFNQQNPKNIELICQQQSQLPLIVISSAISNTNLELKEAKKLNLEILHRSELLANLIEMNKSIVVAGTHGKTTTSTIISTLLVKAKQDPTAIIGGYVPCFQSNARIGTKSLLVAEADESDGTLTRFSPSIGIITNIELDHTNYYKNIEDLIKTMDQFGSNCEVLIANYDCPISKAYLKPSAWFSIKETENIDFSAIPITQNENKIEVNIFEKNHFVDTLNIPLIGLHNLSNTIAAIASCRIHGISFNDLKKHIHEISPPKRRLEKLGIWEGREIIDDYAHHPSEINATLKAAKILVKKNERLAVIFQPHRYTRTKQFMNEFAQSLSLADLVFLAPIYSAGEKFIENANSQYLAKEIIQLRPELKVITGDNLEELIDLIKKYTKPKDILLSMGAGDINSIWNHLELQNLSEICQQNHIAA